MPSNKYNRDFSDNGALKRPGRVSLRVFDDISNAGDGYPGLQRIVKNLMGSFYDKYVIEGCVYSGTSLTTGWIMINQVAIEVSAQTIVVANGEYLYLNSSGVAVSTAVIATAEAGLILFMRSGAGVGTNIRTYFADNELNIYKLTVKTDLDVDGNLDIDGDFNVDGDFTLIGTATVSGELTVTNNLNVTGNMDLTGDMDIGGDVDLSGNIVMDSGNISGVGTINVTTVVVAADFDMDDNDLINNKTITYNAEVAHGDSGASETIDFENGQKHSVTVSENTTLTLAPPDNGMGNFLIKILNGSAFTLEWATEGAENIYWAGGEEPTWTASGTDIIAIYYDGTDFYCQAGIDFS